MKFAYMLSAIAVAAALSACANNPNSNAAHQTTAPDPYGIASLSSSQQQPNVSGTINIRQRSVTAGCGTDRDVVRCVACRCASACIVAKAVRTEGKQAPFNFVLPYNRADIKPNARILLSSAITVNGQLMFITDTVQTVVTQGGNRADLVLVPVQHAPVPVANDMAPMAQ